MSLILKILLIFSFLNISSSSISLKQTKYSNDFFYDKEYEMVQSQLYYYLYQFESIIPDNAKEFFEKIIVYVAKFWVKTKFLPSSIFFDEQLLNCANEFLVLYNEEEKNDFYVYLENTGKSMNDFGNEHFCFLSEAKKNNYYLLQAFLENGTRMTNYEDVTLIKFFDQRCFYLGICLPHKCSIISNRIANNKQFREFLYQYLYLNNLSLIDVNATVKDIYEIKYGSIGNSLKYFIYATFVIKLIFSGIRYIFMDKGYERYVLDRKEKNKEKFKENIIEEEEKEKNENKGKESFPHKLQLTNNSRESELREAYFDYIYGISSKEESNLYSPFNDTQDSFPLRIKIMKTLDLIDNMKLLFSVSNKYYNSCGIKRIYILKILTISMAISLKLMISQLELPSKSFLVYDFYKSYLFSLTKICVFSSIFWIVLEAMTAGYKLMSFLKKKIATSNDNKLNFLSFVQFCLLLIPKIILFILVYIILHCYSKHLIFSFADEKHKGPFILYEKVISRTEYSFRHNDSFIKNIAPIWINYIDYFIKEDPNENKKEIIINETDVDKINYTTFYEYDLSRYKIPSPFLTNTELFINIYLNEFVILVFMIFITYFSYKIKKGIFDCIIFIINIGLYILPAFNLTKYIIDDNSDEKYTLLHVLGQNFSEKYTHYFINFYYFGFLLGVIFFYNNEINNYKINKFDDSITINSGISHNTSYDSFSSTNNENNYLSCLPFYYFCKKIISILNKIKIYIKWLIIALSCAFIVLMSFTFYIIQECHEKTEEFDEHINDDFKLKIPKLNEPWIKFIFLYEKNLCCIFYFIFLLMFISLPHNNLIIKFCDLNCFIFFERISFSIFCTYNFFVYMAFCVFYLDFKVTTINIFLTTVGLFILITIVNIYIVCTFELPFRIIIKSFMNRNLAKEFKKDIIPGGLLSPSMRTTINDK